MTNEKTAFANWINVNDRRPNPDWDDTFPTVLGFFDGQYILCYLNGWVGGNRWEHLETGNAVEITHWMPLPEPPEQEKI